MISCYLFFKQSAGQTRQATNNSPILQSKKAVSKPTHLSASSKKQGDWIISYFFCFLVTLKFAASRQTFRLAHVHFCLKNWANVFKKRKDCTTCEVKQKKVFAISCIQVLKVYYVAALIAPPASIISFLSCDTSCSRQDGCKGCQIFLGVTNQNGKHICTKMATKNNKWP
jgi:hypothetical protein